MTNQVLIKRTVTPSKVPTTTDVALGELAVNSNDGILFFKKNTGGIDTILSLNPDVLNTSYNPTTGVPWASITGTPSILPGLSAGIQVSALSGTSLIPFDTSVPLITEGTQIATITYSPSSPSSKMKIEGDLVIDCSTANRNFIVSVFRDSVCIGVSTVNFIAVGRPQTFSFTMTDLDMGTLYQVSNPVYSVRIGINSAATWYINRLATDRFGGMLANNSIIFSEYV